MALQSYLNDTAGAMVAGATFTSDDAARAAVELLRGAGVRMQDLSVIARDRRRARAIAGDDAWTPARVSRGVLQRLVPRPRLPKDVRRRYGGALRSGDVLVLAVADGQPADTLAALLAQARGERVQQWWQPPCDLFAPPELAGPF